MSNTLKIAAISGSLRKASYNTALMRAAIKVAPTAMQFTEIFLHDIPLYNGDVQDAGFPSIIQNLNQKLRDTDAVLIVSPEYNYSIPGVLKNAIDWLSRFPEQVFNNKVVGIMGASMGGLGTCRMQYHLRQTFVFLNADVMSRPEVMVGSAHEKFSPTGELNDEKTVDFLKNFMEALQQKIINRK